ncbi:Protein FAM32A [Lachnellula cervina]|uniref:Protein FAM32A n=1 Tax=Lachnellula cervina TaxID=1316786 RepID=A0A7D8Z0B3_9HELO|nr:Protein FAM32A [Lachnellula cervina]
MPSDDYTPTVRGGLKLKGSAPPKSSSTSKHQTTSTSTSEPTTSVSTSTSTSLQTPPTEENTSTSTSKPNPDANSNSPHDPNLDLKTLEPISSDGKTPSERAYEETRRKRLADRIAREGPKTHKQRVEELNKYLSTLSEHHDMPRIGPG